MLIFDTCFYRQIEKKRVILTQFKKCRDGVELFFISKRVKLNELNEI